MNNGIRFAVCITLIIGILLGISGCKTNPSDDETTITHSVKTPLPTDVTSYYDEESNLITDTEYSPDELSKNTVTIFDYFNLRVNQIKKDSASVTKTEKKKIRNATDSDGNDIPMSENGYINAAITSLDSYMLHNEETEIEYGKDLSDFLPVKGENFVSTLTLDEIEKASCTDSEGVRTITVTLKSPSLPETIEKAFDTENLDEIMNEFSKANSYLTFEKPVLTYKNCQIIVTANTETDEVIALEYIKSVDVKSKITGTGSLFEMGTVPVIFNYQNKVEYTIDRTITKN